MSAENDVISALVAMTFHLDGQAIEAFLDCWAADGSLTLRFTDGTKKTFSGRNEIAAASQRAFGDTPSPIRHLVMTPIVKLDGDSARIEHHQLYLRIGDPVELAGAGTYSDLWHLEDDGRWRLSRREHTLLSPLPSR